MLVKRVQASREALLDAGAAQWKGAASETVPMKGTPLALQPSPYVKAAWKQSQIGKVKSVRVSALHNGEEIFFRLSWADANDDEKISDSNVFPDGAALLFPMGADAPLTTMGSKTQPVNAWHWRADFGEAGKNNVAEGLGTTRLTAASGILCRASWQGGSWQLVMSRALAVPEQAAESVQLRPGAAVKVAVAVWEGANGERGGVKAFCEAWRPIQLEA
jgi:complex iron-sulfur molybdoenzyme family reductase subunit gamma